MGQVNNLEVRLALEVGQRLVDDFSEPDPSLDTDIFRQVVGSTNEILLKAVQKVPSETRTEYGRLPWTELGRIKAHSLAEWVDMDESIFWQTLRKQLPLLVKSVNTIIQKDH